MFNRIRNSLLTIILSIGVLIGTVGFSRTPTSTLGFRQTAVLADQADGQVLFAQLITDDIEMTGPFDSENILFNLPPNWALSPGGTVNLSMAVAFNLPIQPTSGALPYSGGTLTVRFNDAVIGVVSLNQLGENTVAFRIPDSALRSVRDDGLDELRFTLDSGFSCNFDENMLLIIHTNSSMSLPHTTVVPSTKLVEFPSPIFRSDSFYQSSALVIIPDQPSPAELQAALSIAAGFGNLTSRRLLMDINAIGHLSQQQILANHLILVGRAATASFSSALKLPMPVSGGRFENPNGHPDDGIVQMINSPWSADKVVLVVSGNSDAGTVKAAQAVTTGILRPNALPNVAIIDQVQSVSPTAGATADQTLSQLGYKNDNFSQVGVNTAEYRFRLPPGEQPSDDAYFELSFGHSALLDYARSGIVMTLNGTPIGSTGLTEQTAGTAVNRVRFSIPRAIVLTGSNVLRITFNLTPVDRCSNPNLSAVFANIWADSLLHLPTTKAVTSATVNYNLTLYPAPFANNPTLGETAFVLQKGDIEGWRAAFNIAAYLGDQANGLIMTPMAFFGDNVPASERSKYSFLMIGEASKLALIKDINSVLPAPFESAGDLAAEPQMQVKYRISPTALVGYVQILPSPWNSNQAILLATGNTTQSELWAASYLIEPQSYRLAGNFAAINDQQVVTTDTRQNHVLPGAVTAEGTPVVEVVPPSVNSDTPAPYRPGWLLPGLIVSALLIVLTIAIVAYKTWSGNQSVRKPKAGDNGNGKPNI